MNAIIKIERLPDEDTTVDDYDCYTEAEKKQFYSGKRWFIRICATARVRVPIKGNIVLQKFESGGLLGIENDSDEEYLKQIEAEQIEELKLILSKFGITEFELEAHVGDGP